MANDLINAVKTGDIAEVERLLGSGADVNAGDEQGWTPLNFAAGKGDLPMTQLLIEKGADVFKVGRDNRTPYKIALAAGRVDVVKYLREIEDAKDADKARSLRPQRKYCKAYHLGSLRQFSGWSEKTTGGQNGKAGDSGDHLERTFQDDYVVFIHQDFTVTESMWRNESVIFDQVTPQWQEFCSNTLKFKVPDDIDLIAAPVGAGQS